MFGPGFAIPHRSARGHPANPIHGRPLNPAPSRHLHFANPSLAASVAFANSTLGMVRSRRTGAKSYPIKTPERCQARMPSVQTERPFLFGVDNIVGTEVPDQYSTGEFRARTPSYRRHRWPTRRKVCRTTSGHSAGFLLNGLRGAAVAQSVEHRIRNAGVVGSNPICGTNIGASVPLPLIMQQYFQARSRYLEGGRTVSLPPPRAIVGCRSCGANPRGWPVACAIHRSRTLQPRCGRLDTTSHGVFTLPAQLRKSTSCPGLNSPSRIPWQNRSPCVVVGEPNGMTVRPRVT